MRIAIIGQGGHSKVVQEIITSSSENQIVGFFDDKYSEFTLLNQMYIGPVLSSLKMIELFDDIRYIIAIGNNRVRKLISEQLAIPGSYYSTFIHKKAVVSRSARIGNGSVIMANAVINADAEIGSHTIINTSSIIEHDNKIGNFAHISPNTTLTGAVAIGEGAHIGAGATVIPNTEIGEWSVIGAGASVIHDIPANSLAVGVPARVKMKKIVGGV